MTPNNPNAEALNALSQQLATSLEQGRQTFQLEFNAWLQATSEAVVAQQKINAKAAEAVLAVMKPFKGK